MPSCQRNRTGVFKERAERTAGGADQLIDHAHADTLEAGHVSRCDRRAGGVDARLAVELAQIVTGRDLDRAGGGANQHTRRRKVAGRGAADRDIAGRVAAHGGHHIGRSQIGTADQPVRRAVHRERHAVGGDGAAVARARRGHETVAQAVRDGEVTGRAQGQPDGFTDTVAS